MDAADERRVGIGVLDFVDGATGRRREGAAGRSVDAAEPAGPEREHQRRGRAGERGGDALVLEFDGARGARIVASGQYRDIAGVGEIEPAGGGWLTGQGPDRELLCDAVSEMSAPGVRSPDPKGLIRQHPGQRRPSAGGGRHPVDAIGDDVGARQRPAGNHVPDQRLANLAEHPLRGPNPRRVDLGSQRSEHRAEHQTQDRDDHGKLDEGEPRLTPGPGPGPGPGPASIVRHAHVAESPGSKDTGPVGPGASDAARVLGRRDVRRARKGVGNRAAGTLRASRVGGGSDRRHPSAGDRTA